MKPKAAANTPVKTVRLVAAITEAAPVKVGFAGTELEALTGETGELLVFEADDVLEEVSSALELDLLTVEVLMVEFR